MDKKLNVAYILPYNNSSRPGYHLERARRELSVSIYNELLEVGGRGVVTIVEAEEPTHVDSYLGGIKKILCATVEKVNQVPLYYELTLPEPAETTWREIWKLIWRKLTR